MPPKQLRTIKIPSYPSTWGSAAATDRLSIGSILKDLLGRSTTVASQEWGSLLLGWTRTSKGPLGDELALRAWNRKKEPQNIEITDP